MSDLTVSLEHPELPGQLIDVPESAVPIHAASGWVLRGDVPRVAEPAAKPATRGKAAARTSTDKES